MAELIEALAVELSRPRELTARVLNYIREQYSLDDQAIGAFLVEQLPGLEDDEIDLILSPLFTPKLSDQAVFAELLGSKAAPREDWRALVEQLAARPIRAELVTPDGVAHSVPLREVTIERYVHRLRLDARIPEALLDLIDGNSAPSDRAMFKAIARQAVWENGGSREILDRFLHAAAAQGSFKVEEALDLLSVVEARKPSSLDDLIEQIPAWRESLRQQIDAASGGKPFFHEQIREMHGGGRDQRGRMGVQPSAKEKEFQFLGRLEQLLTR